MQRYHPILVGLHWLMAFIIIMSLIFGGFVLTNIPADSPEKLQMMGGHMFGGLLIGGLLLVRLATRVASSHPPRATTGHALLDRIGIWTHWLFYILIAGMVLSGLATAVGAGLFPIVYGDAGGAAFPDLSGLPQRAAHGLIALLLACLAVLHIAAAFYHQFVLKDGLFRRMWFGKRS